MKDKKEEAILKAISQLNKTMTKIQIIIQQLISAIKKPEGYR